MLFFVVCKGACIVEDGEEYITVLYLCNHIVVLLGHGVGVQKSVAV